MIPLNYHHLYYFWETAKAGSISAAKDKLLLAQPTLSLQISQLEKALGHKLFHRSRQGVSLTVEGKIVFEHCEVIFRQGEALLSALRSGPSARPPLAIGVGKTLSRQVVLSILDEVRRIDPSIQTMISTGSQEELEERLARHTVDMAVLDRDRLSSSSTGLRSRHVASIPVLFVAAPALKKALGRFPKSGQRVQMLLRPKDNPTRRAVDDYLRAKRVEASVVAEVEDSYLIRILAIQGKGAAALNALAAREEIAAGRLAALEHRACGIKEDVWLLARALPHPDAGLRRAIDRLLTGLTIKL